MFPTVMVFKAWPLLHRVNIHLSTASLSLSLSSRRTRLSPSFHLHPLPLPSNGVHRSLRQLLAVIARNHTRGYYENDSGRCAFLFSPLSLFFDSFCSSFFPFSTLLQHPFGFGNVSAKRSRKDTYKFLRRVHLTEMKGSSLTDCLNTFPLFFAKKGRIE